VTTIERAIAPLGLRIDRSSPMVDARLPDGSRLHAVLPPAAVEHPLLAIRRFTQRVGELEDLVSAGTATREQIELIAAAVSDRRTVVVSGGTGAGKTTLLNLMAGQIEVGERIVTIEDAAELDLPGHVVRLEARPANAEGAGEITVRSLIKSALRLRPDRIIVGEVRGPEALDLISAMNTGHRGSLTTVHANSPREAMLRLETLALSAGDASESAIARQLDAAVETVVQIDRVGSERRISGIADIEDLRGWSG
jgi:pilus assembly protein CpaF